MIYLLIMFLVAGTGLASLWVQQRRTKAHLETVDGFRSSLEALSAAPVVRPRRRAPAPSRRAGAPRRVAATTSPGRRGAPAHRTSRHALDAERRAAARKRIEARRRAASRSRTF